jgi:hypothetical protein
VPPPPQHPHARRPALACSSSARCVAELKSRLRYARRSASGACGCSTAKHAQRSSCAVCTSCSMFSSHCRRKEAGGARRFVGACMHACRQAGRLGSPGALCARAGKHTNRHAPQAFSLGSPARPAPAASPPLPAARARSAARRQPRRAGGPPAAPAVCGRAARRAGLEAPARWRPAWLVLCSPASTTPPTPQHTTPNPPPAPAAPPAGRPWRR